jgi:hypothetical protein
MVTLVSLSRKHPLSLRSTLIFAEGKTELASTRLGHRRLFPPSAKDARDGANAELVLNQLNKSIVSNDKIVKSLLDSHDSNIVKDLDSITFFDQF